MSTKDIERISKALSDPCRLKIMEAIKKQRDWLQCGAILEMSDLSQSTMSHHLKQLVDAELLIAVKEGRNIKYQINNEIFAAYIRFLSPFENHKN